MIRVAIISDFTAIYNLEEQVFNLHLKAHPDMIKSNLPFSKEYYESLLNDENVKIFVYTEDDEVLGYCITKRIEYDNHHLFYDMTILEINDMCVDEKVRGKNIGRQLFDRAKEYAIEIGATRIELSVWHFNENARNFYKHLGMKERIYRMELIL